NKTQSQGGHGCRDSTAQTGALQRTKTLRGRTLRRKIRIKDQGCYSRAIDRRLSRTLLDGNRTELAKSLRGCNSKHDKQCHNYHLRNRKGRLFLRRSQRMQGRHLLEELHDQDED